MNTMDTLAELVAQLPEGSTFSGYRRSLTYTDHNT